MDLWYAPTSPFARKVRVAAHEMGLNTRLRLIETNPWTDPRLRQVNPLAKVPTLVLDDGEVVWELALIVERLSSLAPNRALIPTEGDRRWSARSLQALADGACTAAGRLFAEERKPSGQRSDAMMARFSDAIAASLDHLEQQTFSEPPTIGEIAAAILPGYLDFRWPQQEWPDRDWRTGRPRLTAWFEAFAQRPSMIATTHVLPDTET